MKNQEVIARMILSQGDALVVRRTGFAWTIEGYAPMEQFDTRREAVNRALEIINEEHEDWSLTIMPEFGAGPRAPLNPIPE